MDFLSNMYNQLGLTSPDMGAKPTGTSVYDKWLTQLMNNAPKTATMPMMSPQQMQPARPKNIQELLGGAVNTPKLSTEQLKQYEIFRKLLEGYEKQSKQNTQRTSPILQDLLRRK